MYSKFIIYLLGVTIFFTGLYAGVGFFTVMGGNPAIAKLGDKSFAEYWQQIDGFMGARMPVAGPVITLSVLLSTIFLFRNSGSSPSFWLMLIAFLIMVIDIVFTLNVNHPLNQLIQSWDIENLPDNVSEIKMKVYAAFNIRLWFMILSFVFAILSVWSFFLKILKS